MNVDYAQLVEGCKRRDRRAQRALYDDFAPMAMGVCMRYMHDREEARDMMQEGFIRVFERIGQVKDPQQVGGWIYKVMMNVCLKQYHRQMRKVPVVLVEDYKVETGEWSLESGEWSVESVVEAMQKLSPQQRVVFNLIAVEEYEYAEVAKELKCTEVNVRALYSRARKEMRNILKPKTSDETEPERI